MITIRVQNFQAVQDQTIEVDGFTAITGPNNVGKTSFLRAIRGVFQNARGYGFVRHGESHCTVEITFEDGTKVTWEKGKSRNRYRIGDSDWFKKVGSGVPEEIATVLGVVPVVAGSASLTPHFNVAGENVFLLNDPGSVLAEAVSDVERVGLLNRSLKEAESERRSVRSTLKVRTSDFDSTSKHLKEFEGLSEIGTGLSTIVELRKEAEQLRRTSQTMSKDLVDWQSSNRICAALQGIENLRVPSDADVEKAQQAGRASAALSQFHLELEQVETQIAKLEAKMPILDVIPDVEDVQDLQIKLQVLQTNFRDWKRLTGEVTHLEGQVSILSAIPEDLSIPEAETLTTLQTLRQELDIADRGVVSAEVQIEDVQSELQTLEDFLSCSLQDLGECPLCGGVV